MALREKINFWLDVLVRPDDISSDYTEIITKSDKLSNKDKKDLTKDKLEAEKILDKNNSVVVINPIVEKVVQSRVRSTSKSKAQAKDNIENENIEKDDQLEL